MKTHIRFILTGVSVLLFFSLVWFFGNPPENLERAQVFFGSMSNNVGATFFAESITATQLKEKYNNVSTDTPPTPAQKIRLLLVPGHEPDYGGTIFKDVKEKDIAVELGNYLESFLKSDPHYDVIMARDTRAWNPVLETYFEQHALEIDAFYEKQKDTMTQLIENGLVTRAPSGVIHNSAPPIPSLHLYGINKWANENTIDIVLHIHFNDYPRKNTGIPGTYSGFSIYVPERQYSNSTTTRAVADAIFKRLTTYNAPSNLASENGGIVEDQELIAIGRYNTADAPSMLIEYGYIYESQFLDKKIRASVLKDMAFQTFLGIQDFFGNKRPANTPYDTTILPYVWTKHVNKNTKNNADVLALQMVLMRENFYPASGETKNDCPLTGNFGPCTVKALRAFQTAHAINGETGIIGVNTGKILNEIYSH